MSERETREGAGWRAEWLCGVIIVLACAAVFGAVARNGILWWDDSYHIVENPWFKQIDSQSFAHFWGEPYGNLYIPVAYNAEYDRKVLVAELARAGLLPENPPPALRRNVEWIDPLIWARELQKTEKSRTLAEVAERLGVVIDKAHRAADDALATLEVLSMFRRDTRVPKTYGAFVQEQRRLSRLFDGERQRWRRY